MMGGFSLEATAPLGRYILQAHLLGKSFSGEFKVEKYRKPEFKVTVRTDKPHYTSGEPIKATINASYYFGGPVAKGQVRYFVFRSRHYQDPWQGLEYSWYYSEAELPQPPAGPGAGWYRGARCRGQPGGGGPHGRGGRGFCVGTSSVPRSSATSPASRACPSSRPCGGANAIRDG